MGQLQVSHTIAGLVPKQQEIETARIGQDEVYSLRASGDHNLRQ